MDIAPVTRKKTRAHYTSNARGFITPHSDAEPDSRGVTRPRNTTIHTVDVEWPGRGGAENQWAGEVFYPISVG